MIETDVLKSLKKYLQGSSKLALLLDYDGTLAKVSKDETGPQMPQTSRDILHRLSKLPNVFVALISGRELENLLSLSKLENITCAGNHGYRIKFADGSRYNHEISKPVMDQFQKMIIEITETYGNNGAYLENKGEAATFHTRNLRQDLQKEYNLGAKEIVAKYGFHIIGAVHGFEVRPTDDWNKGTTAIFLLEKEFGKDWRNDVKAIYAGDDYSDEDAMKALKGYAMTFRIAASKSVNTCADKIISSTEDIVEILKWLDAYYCQSNVN